MADYQALNSELVSDPLSRGYAGMTDAEAAADLNTVYRTRNITSMSASQVLNKVDATEYAALADLQKNTVWGLLGMGTLNPWGVEATIIQQVFGGGSATVAALAASRTETISRAAELGLGVVTTGDVQKARAYPG